RERACLRRIDSISVYCFAKQQAGPPSSHADGHVAFRGKTFRATRGYLKETPSPEGASVLRSSLGDPTVNPRKRCTVFLAAALACAAAQPALAQPKSDSGDWPGWRGPDRTGVSKETGLLKEWPEGGPKLAWKIKGLGDGYSTPSIAGGKIFVLGT